MKIDNRTKTRIKQQIDCRCQRCASCIDNARWERIFQEKFADPTYYTRQQGRSASPMADL